MRTFEEWLVEHHPEYLEGFNDWPWWKKALATGVIGGVGSWGASKALDATAGKLIPGKQPAAQVSVQDPGAVQPQQKVQPATAQAQATPQVVTPAPVNPQPAPAKKVMKGRGNSQGRVVR